MDNLQWEVVVFKEPALTVYGNYIYFNSSMRSILENEKGVDFFKAFSPDGKIILSVSPGKQFLFAPKKGEKRIICKELVDYIQSVYDSRSHFNLVREGNRYVLC